MNAYPKCTAILGVLLSFSAIQATAQEKPATAPNRSAAAAPDYGKLPISFTANQGEADAQVRYFAHGNGYSLFLTDSAAVLRLTKPAAISPGAAPKLAASPGMESRPNSLKSDIVQLQLAGSFQHPTVDGTDLLPGTANFFIGNDPKKWHSSVPTFARVKYAGVYPGVDLVYYGNQSQLEFDFVVAPGADSDVIKLHFSGAKKLSLTAGGDLNLSTPGGKITFHKPEIYQLEDGKREPIDGAFSLPTRNTVGFRIGRYDAAKPLVIDPVLAYSTYLGGMNQGSEGGDYASSIAVDSSGNAYVTGQAISVDFPVTSGAYQTTNPLDVNVVFVAKLNPSGSALIYSTYIGGNVGQYATGIAVDASGEAYVTGESELSDYPVTSGAFQNVINGNAVGNVFVTKLNASGTTLIYSTLFGGSNRDTPAAIALDSSGNAYITGEAQSTNYPVTSGAFQAVKNTSDGYNAFITQLNPQGSGLVYSTYLGGSNSDHAASIAVSSSGVAYVTGQTASADFPVSSGAFQSTLNVQDLSDGGSAFITALSASGSSLVYSTFLGGTYTEAGSGITVDKVGNAYVTGVTYSQDFPVTSGAFQTVKASPAIGNAFITKINSGGTALVYSTYLGGANLADEHKDYGSAIVVDQFGDAFVTGTEQSPDFPVTPGALQTTDPSYEDIFNNAFISELSPAGTALLYSTYFGGSEDDYGNGIALDGEGGVYVAGETYSGNLPVSDGAFQSINNGYAYGGPNAFVAKLSIGPAPAVLTTPAPGTVLSTSATFSWTAGTGVSLYELVLGTTGVGSHDLFTSGQTTATSATVNSLPANGGTIYARLWSKINGVWQSSDYTYTESGAPMKAALTTPTPGTTLGTSATFSWSTGTGVSLYELVLGTTGVGSHDLFTSGESKAMSATVNSLPSNGGTIYARLWSEINGAWQSSDYTYTESGAPMKAALTTPAPGTVLSTSATFSWTTGTGVSLYELVLGTTGVGSHDLFTSGESKATSATVNSLPASGGTIYARLWSEINGAWQSSDYTYIESGSPMKAALTTPTPGTVLGASATFSWSTGTGVSLYELVLGTTGVGSHNLFTSGETMATSATVNSLPANGGTIYVRLWSEINGVWLSSDYTYIESGSPMKAVLTTPTPGTVLSTSATFSWTTGTGVSLYELVLGTTGVGSHNLFTTGETTATSAAVSSLPANGGTIYARLWSEIGEAWQSSDYTYLESGAPLTLAQGATESILYTFTGNGPGTGDGWSPAGGMVMDSQGNLYGTTVNGGGSGDYGTVFKISPSGQETILYSFVDSPDGAAPYGGLVMDAQGNLYGTTREGPDTTCGETVCGGIAGAVFKVTPSGAETTLHSFQFGLGSSGTDGIEPNDGLVMDRGGNLYGTTSNGGNATGCGTVFKVTPGGVETVLYSFSGPDGCNPGALDLSGNGGPGLAMDANGNLYGTTYDGGANGSGVVFKLTADGSTETVLHSFANNGTDGYGPLGGLALDSQGNLYGTTFYGGIFGPVGGTIFKVASDGAESVLYSFGNSQNGGLYGVQPGLVMDSHQNLYGSIGGDGSNYDGFVFQFAPTGVLTILHDFPSSPVAGSHDGVDPQGGLLLAANGSLYGTTSSDPVYGSGTIFQLSPSPSATAAPVLSVAPGTYSSPQTVTITDVTPGATIYYSLGGIAYANYGPVYGGPLTISSTTALSAIAVAPDGTASLPIQAIYTITTP